MLENNGMQETNAYRILMVKYVGKRPLGRSKGRFDNNVAMNLKWISFVD